MPRTACFCSAKMSSLGLSAGSSGETYAAWRDQSTGGGNAFPLRRFFLRQTTGGCYAARVELSDPMKRPPTDSRLEVCCLDWGAVASGREGRLWLAAS